MDQAEEPRRRRSSRGRRSSSRARRDDSPDKTRRTSSRARRSSNTQLPPTGNGPRDNSRTRSRRHSSTAARSSGDRSSTRQRSSSPSKRRAHRRESDETTGRSMSKNRSERRSSSRSQRTRSSRRSSSNSRNHANKNQRRTSGSSSNGDAKDKRTLLNDEDDDNEDDDDDDKFATSPRRRRRHRKMWDDDVDLGDAGAEHELGDGTQAVAHLKGFNLERLAALMFRKGTSAFLRCLDHRLVNPVATSLGVGLRPLLHADFESNIRHGYGRNAVVKIRVHHTDELSEDPLLFHPVVRVSIVNGATGFLLAKTDLNRPATSFEEASMTIKVRTLAKGQIRIERESAECAVIAPQLTAPCEIKGGSARVVAPSWSEQDPIVFNIDYSELLQPNVLIFFELLDFGNAIPFDRVSKRDGFYHVAWAFLKPVSSAHQPNVPVVPAHKLSSKSNGRSTRRSDGDSSGDDHFNSSDDNNSQGGDTSKKQQQRARNNVNTKEHPPMRLQFYRYPNGQSFLDSAYEEREYRGERGNWPYVFHVYRRIHRVKYPSTLYVNVEGTTPSSTSVVTHRPTCPTQQEVYPQSLEELIEDDILGLGQAQGEDGTEREVAMARRFRMRHEECRIPTQLAGRIPVGNMGCFAVEFSPDGRLLAASCGDDDEHFPVRIFVVATGKLKCCLYAHKSLVYEMSWQHPETTHRQNDEGDDDDEDEDGSVNSDTMSHSGGAKDAAKKLARAQVPAAVDGYQLATASADGCALVWWIPGGARRRSSKRNGQSTARTDGSNLSHPHRPGTSSAEDDDDDENDDEGAPGGQNEDDLLLGGDAKSQKTKRARARERAMQRRAGGGGGVGGDNGGGALGMAGLGPRIICRLTHDPPVYVYSVQHHPVAKDPVVVMTGSYDGLVRLWDTETGECYGALDKGRRHHEASVNSIIFTPDGHRLISGDAAGVVNVWRLETGKQASDPNAWHLARSIKDPELKGKSITSVRTHPKEKLLLVSAHGRMLLLFEMRRYTRVHRSFAGSSILKSMIRATFSADGKYVLAGGEDGCPHFWNTITSLGAAASRWQGRACFGKPMYDVAWHPSEHLVAFASFGGDFPILLYDTNRNSAAQQHDEFDDAEATAKAREEMARRDNRHRLHMLKTNKIAAKLATLTLGNKENRGAANDAEHASVPKLKDLVTLRTQGRVTSGAGGGGDVLYGNQSSSADATSALTQAAALTLGRETDSPSDSSDVRQSSTATEWSRARRDSASSSWSASSAVERRIAKVARRRGSVESVVSQARELLRRTSVDGRAEGADAARAAVAADDTARRTSRSSNQNDGDHESSSNDDDL